MKGAGKGVMNLLDILKEDPIYGGRLKNLKSKEMGYERRKFQLIIELGRKTYRLYFQKKITDQNIQGAPDIVIEVLSPGTALKDRREKKLLYENFKVQEYLVVDPIGQTVERYRLQEDGSWDKGEIFGPEQTLTFHFLPDVSVDLAEVFEIEAAEEKISPPTPPPTAR